MKKILCTLLSLVLALTGLVGLCMTAQAFDTIEFGTYPQTRVEPTIKMREAAKAAQWKSYGYYSGDSTGSFCDGKMEPGDFMQYADFVYNGIKYRAVTFSKYRPYDTANIADESHSYQNKNGYTTDEIYCFKYEPLKWRVLDPSTGLILCEKAIDAQAYHNYALQSDGEYYGDEAKTHLANNYYYSSIRQWLNEDFYNTAFTNAQKSDIKETELDNSCYNPSFTQFNAPASCDKVFLLSYNDAKNTAYGFSSKASENDAARRVQSTDYAKCQGVAVSTSSNYAGNAGWWLRSPYSASHTASYVDSSGWADYYYTNRPLGGVRPTCCLTTLKSDTALSYYLPSAGKYDTTGAALAIKKNPTKTTYTYRKDTDLDLSGMEAELTFANGTKATLDPSECTVSGYSAKPAGTKTITVTYEGLTAQFNVTVKYAWWQQIIRFLLLGFLWY